MPTLESAAAQFASSHRTPSLVPTPPRSKGFRTDIFPLRRTPKAASIASVSSRASSFERPPAFPFRLEVPFSEEDPFAPATVTINRARGARVSDGSALPPELYDLLRSPPPPKKRRHRHVKPDSSSRRELSEDLEVVDPAPAAGFVQKSLSAFKGNVARRASNLSLADTLSSFRSEAPSRPFVHDAPVYTTPRRKLSIASSTSEPRLSWFEYAAKHAKPAQHTFPGPPSPPLSQRGSTTPPLASAATFPVALPDTPPSSLKTPNSPPTDTWSRPIEEPAGLEVNGFDDSVPLPSPTSAIFTFPPAKPVKARSTVNPTRPPRRPVNLNALKALPPTPLAVTRSRTDETPTSPKAVSPARSPAKVARRTSVATSLAPSMLPAFLHPPSRILQSVFDLSTRTLATRLNLALCYILALRLPTAGSVDVTIASEYELLALVHTSDHPPTFHTSLHLRALRNIEGGLLYRKPAGRSGTYERGILLPVAESDGVGIVLAGFSVDPDKGFATEDLDVFVNVAKQVRRCIVKSSAAPRPGTK